MSQSNRWRFFVPCAIMVVAAILFSSSSGSRLWSKNSAYEFGLAGYCSSSCTNWNAESSEFSGFCQTFGNPSKCKRDYNVARAFIIIATISAWAVALMMVYQGNRRYLVQNNLSSIPLNLNHAKIIQFTNFLTVLFGIIAAACGISLFLTELNEAALAQDINGGKYHISAGANTCIAGFILALLALVVNSSKVYTEAPTVNNAAANGQQLQPAQPQPQHQQHQQYVQGPVVVQPHQNYTTANMSAEGQQVQYVQAQPVYYAQPLPQAYPVYATQGGPQVYSMPGQQAFIQGSDPNQPPPQYTAQPLQPIIYNTPIYGQPIKGPH
jgi:hypothetical protein